MIENLQAYIALLKKEREIVEVSCSVDPYLEAAEIHRRIVDDEGPALLFTNIKGSSFPLATNLFGSVRRLNLAFGKRPENLIKNLARIPETLLPPSFGKLWSQRSLLWNLATLGTKSVGKGSLCTNHVTSPSLSSLPLLTSWSGDVGPLLTLPLVYTVHPSTGIQNLGVYRMQRFDDRTMGMHLPIGKGISFHIAAAHLNEKPLPVNVLLGGSPALMLAAMAPLPENIPELLLASLLLGKKVSLSSNPSGKLPLLADAEIALVGEINPHETKSLGSFGDHYGYYTRPHDYPVFRCNAMYHRKNAICVATVLGKPGQEDSTIGNYLQELFAPLLPTTMPTVLDFWAYSEAGYRSLATAVVRQRFRREAMVSVFRILGEGQLTFTKFLLVTDKQMELKDIKAVLEYVLERCDFHTDFYIFSNLAMYPLDYTGPKANEGSKGILIGVGKPVRELPSKFNGELPSFISKAIPFCRGCLVLEGASHEDSPELSDLAVSHPGFSEWPLLVLVDNAESTLKSNASFIWTTFTRFDPGADIKANHKEILRNHLSLFRPILIDARMKQSYPKELEVEPETTKLVDSRWKSYFPG